MRIGLARLLLSDPELLILDEPTNHLDAKARRWLGEYVGEYPGTVLVVSHDENFVNAAAESIAEVAGGRLDLYKSCSHNKYLELREIRQQQAEASVEAAEREAKKLEDFIKKWGAQATKAKQAKDREAKLGRVEKRIEAAKRLVKEKRHQPKLKLADAPGCIDVPLELEGARLRHPEGTQDILKDVSISISRGMRLIMRGPNGAGKSTLLKALGGKLELQAGKRTVDVERLRLGLFAQDLAQELPQDEVADEYVSKVVQEEDPTVDSQRIRNVMGALGLGGDKATRRIGALSGGEKARVALAVFCLTPYNVLLFDEPSNHLDVEAIAALVDALQDYEGAMVVISHDRNFCEALSATHIAYIADGTVSIEQRSILKDSDFSEADKGVANVDEASMDTASPEEKKAAKKAGKKNQELRKQMSKTEKNIAKTEEKMEKLSTKMMEAGADTSKVSKISEEMDELQQKLDKLYEVYEELMLQEA